eukprot:2240224-Pleurochrysis_carterae.AAC.2
MISASQDDSATEGCFLLLQTWSDESPSRSLRTLQEAYSLCERIATLATKRWCKIERARVWRRRACRRWDKTWFGRACLRRRRCPGAFELNSIVKRRPAIDRSCGAQGQARCPVLWPQWLPRRGEVGRLLPGRGSCGMRMGCRQAASVAISTFRRSETGPSSSTFQRDDRSVVKEEYNEEGPSVE